MYTLMSASVLALDLTRHPSGAAVADVVDTALSPDLARLATGPDGSAAGGTVDLERAAARARLLATADRAPRLEQALRTVSQSLAAGAPTSELRVLRAALVGRLDDLVALLVRELGDHLPAPVVDVVVDRAVAAWTETAEGVDPADLARLRAPWRELVGELPPLPPTTGDVRALLGLLEAVARSGSGAWSLLDRAHEAQHRALGWSELMHEASRAAVEAGHTADVARWQLSAVRAAGATGHVVRTCAPGAVMSVVGAVQALAVLDVLPPDVADGLLGPVRAVGLHA